MKRQKKFLVEITEAKTYQTEIEGSSYQEAEAAAKALYDAGELPAAFCDIEISSDQLD